MPPFWPWSRHRPRPSSPPRVIGLAALSRRRPTPPTADRKHPTPVFESTVCALAPKTTGSPGASDASSEIALFLLFLVENGAAMIGHRRSCRSRCAGPCWPGNVHRCPESGCTVRAASSRRRKRRIVVSSGRRRGPNQRPQNDATQEIVEGIFGAGIGERKPLLQKVDAQHDRQANRLTAVASLSGSAARSVASRSRQGTTTAITLQKLFTTALFRAYFSKLAWLAKVI